MTELKEAHEGVREPANGTIAPLAEIYERTAWALDHSAELAETHAHRHSLAGQTNAAEDEQLTAEWARKAAQRARQAAQRARQAADRARQSADRAHSSSDDGSSPTADPER